MITGYNTDVEHDGKTYHVQTEDKGLANPVVESLVYCRGEIVASRRNSYADLVGDYSEEAVQQRMEAQHQTLIRDIRNGRFDAGDFKPFGHSIVTNRSFDEVVMSFLHDHVPVERIQLKLKGPRVLRGGSRPTLRFTVLETTTERPICGAHVEVRLAGKKERRQVLFSSSTDERGTSEAVFDLPSLPEEDLAILCMADAGGRTAEIRRQVKSR
jgi:hypothetical protein